MSRRDTMIVAVLVNAALLMILFATAVRSDKLEPAPEKQIELAKAPAEPMISEEELFDQYLASVPTLAEEGEEILAFTEEIELAFTPPPEPVIEEKKEVVQAPKTTEKSVNVTVKKGDFLEKIANANNTSVAAIMKANNMSSTQLKIGQVLKVPLSEAKPKVTPPPVHEEYYVVKDGDNPWLIASRNNIRLDQLLKLNGLDEQKARRLRPGDRLRIR